MTWQTLIIALACLILVLAPKIVNLLTPPADVTVSACHDGDTCRVQLPNHIYFNVRLAGIDAPESAQTLGGVARDYLEKLLMGHNLKIQQIDLDLYNRPVVQIYADNRLVNCAMLEAGLAEMYRGPSKLLNKNDYSLCESRAKIQKAGIWGLANYVSPKEFRTAFKRKPDKSGRPRVKYRH